jgi:GntR family transcriptional regulator
VAQALGVESGTQVLTRSRRFIVDDRPVQPATLFIPLEPAAGTAIEHGDAGVWSHVRPAGRRRPRPGAVYGAGGGPAGHPAGGAGAGMPSAWLPWWWR